MRLPLALPLLALAAAAPCVALAQDAPSLRDFSLPPPPTPTASPRVQGPVDPDQPVPARPRPVSTATPRTVATPLARPVITLPAPSPTAARPNAATVATPAARSPAGAQVRPQLAEPAATGNVAPTPQSPVAEGSPAVPAPALPPLPRTGSSPATLALPTGVAPTPAPADQRQGNLLWLLFAAVGLAALAGAAAWWRRRRMADRPQIIERPVVAANDDPAATDALKVELAAIKLTRSFMNATLAYRVTLRNRSTRALADIGVGGELIGAHGSQPLENQIASAEAQLPELHRVDRLAPGQARTLEGTLTLPVQAITPIRQGSAALFVPLLRLVVHAAGVEPLARTFVVGQPGAGMTGRLTPFRLDEPPRSYQPIGQRALD